MRLCTVIVWLHAHTLNMLWTVFVILGVLWLLAIPTAYTIGALIHVLIVFAIVAVVVQLLSRRAV